MAATHRRRGAAQREAEAAALRAAVRPRFDIKTLQGSASYEFIAKGRAPTSERGATARFERTPRCALM